MLASLCFQGAIEALTVLSLSEPCMIRAARFPPATKGVGVCGVCVLAHVPVCVCVCTISALSFAHTGIAKASHLSHQVWA